MSWEEVGKINSDFTREPLNFNNYINDISTFGKYSYVLDPENSKLWRSLLSQSLTMFGHNAIHETVYERLTDEDVDYMIRHNVRIGQAFNSFYGSSVFVSGVIDTVLKTITSGSYNVLESKLQCGINRYISEKTAGNNAGQWLGTVFDITALKSKTTMASIISDTTLWKNTIMKNESLRYVVCLSASTIDWFANNESTAYINFITEVCNSTKATMDLFTALNGNSKLDTFMTTESAVTVMASKSESMIAVTYMTAPFAAMIASKTAMTIVADSEVAVNVIVDALTNVANSENVLDTIKKNLTAIETALPSIANSETNITEVVEVKTHIADVILSLQKTTTQTDILVANITALVVNQTAMRTIIENDMARTAIEKSENASNGIDKVVDLISYKLQYVYTTDRNYDSSANYYWISSTTHPGGTDNVNFYIDTISGTVIDNIGSKPNENIPIHKFAKSIKVRCQYKLTNSSTLITINYARLL